MIISSVSGREVDFTGTASGAFKAALIHYGRRLAFQLAPKMIRVNSVSPANTYFDGGVLLASPASSFTTGANLVIDGALTCGVQF